jgi:hemerythrin
MAETKSQRNFEQIFAEHLEFKQIHENLRRFLEGPRPQVGGSRSHAWAAELSRRLAELHDKLVMHFRHEEEGGLFETLTGIEPSASRQVDTLAGEHKEILGTVRGVMSDVLTYSEGTSPHDPQIRRRLADVLERLSRHEMAETELMQRLEYRDIGVGD